VNATSEIITGVIVGLVTSVIFLYALSRVRPRFQISERIAKRITPSGNTQYLVKILNRSRRSAIDIRARLHLMTPTMAPGGVVLRSKRLELSRGELFELPGFSRKDQEARYAFRFLTEEHLEDLWEDESQYLRFRLFASDSLSGFGRVFVRDFHMKRVSVVEGDFEVGSSLEIK